MKKRTTLIVSILAALCFVAGYGIFMAATIKPREPIPFRFKVNDRVWYTSADGPAVVYRLNRGATWDDLRYMVEYNVRGRIDMRWVKEGSLEPYTNQVPILDHTYHDR